MRDVISADTEVRFEDLELTEEESKLFECCNSVVGESRLFGVDGDTKTFGSL